MGNTDKIKLNKKITGVFAALIIAMAVIAPFALPYPAYAAVGSSVNEEVINQARAVASLIQTRVQLYWSMWVDEQIPYAQDPLTNPEPAWATDSEIASEVGGYDPEGISFAVDSMPVNRKGSFNLVATVGDGMGGAAAAAYVRNFLPMAVASENTVTVPVLRPSFALGLSDIANNPSKIGRDGTTDDGEPTFLDDADVTFGDNGSITFDPVTGGNINNVNNLTAKNGTFSNNLNIGDTLTAVNGIFTNLTVTNPIDGDLVGDTTGTHTGNVIGNTSGTHIGPVIGDVTGNVLGNAATATSLLNARSIALSGGATGTATSFNGTANITIPVTALNANSLNSGTVAAARLSGTYDVNISGNAVTAGRSNYSSTSGMLKDTDGEAAGAFTIKPLSNGDVEFGGSSAPGIIRFGATGTVQPTEYQFGATGNAILKGIASSASKLATVRSITLGTGASSNAVWFDGSANVTIPVTSLNAGYLNSGTVPTARLSGTYGIDISGRAAAANHSTSSSTAYSANALATGVGINVSSIKASTIKSSGYIASSNFYRLKYTPSVSSGWVKSLGFESEDGSVQYGGVGFYKYAGDVTGNDGELFLSVENNNGYSIMGKNGIYISKTENKIIGDLVTYNSLKPLLQNTSDLGTNTYRYNNIYGNNIYGTNIYGTVSSATKLAVARTIALETAVTGTATAFDGTVNITIPVTALNASYLTGTINAGRLTGSYGIDISGTARWAQGLTTPVTSCAYADNAGTALNVSGGGTVSAVEGTFTSTLKAMIFSSPVGTYYNNVFLGGLDGRGVTAGYSGSGFSGIGYNIQHTATTGIYTAALVDKVSYIGFDDGGFRFFTAPLGANGRTVTLTEIASINSEGQAFFSGAVTAPTFIGNLSGNASTASALTEAGKNALITELDSRYGSSGLKQDSEGYYLIYNYTDLKTVKTMFPTGTNLRLMGDIQVDSAWTPYSTFTGIFDGYGHKIYGIDIDSVVLKELGSIVVGLSSGSTIKNLKVEGKIVNSYVGAVTHTTGGIVAINNGGSIINCINNIAVTHTQIGSVWDTLGGITGLNNGVIDNCINNGTINGNNNATNMGGITGRSGLGTKTIRSKNYGNIINHKNNLINRAGGIVGAHNGEVIECINYADFDYTGNTEEYLISGGIVGSLGGSGSVLSCTNYGNITVSYRNLYPTEAETQKAKHVGGIVAYSAGPQASSISGCVNYGNLNIHGVNVSVGGIMGMLLATQITNCVNNGEVNIYDVFGNLGTRPGYAGGIVGYNGTGSQISQCVNNGSITGKSNNTSWTKVKYVGGIAGFNDFISNSCFITDCQNFGPVNGLSISAYTGGITGSNRGRVLTSDNYGEIAGAITGGICGWLDQSGAQISNCNNYQTVKSIYGSHTGGITGGNSSNTLVENCVNKGAVWNLSPSTNTGGITGYNRSVVLSCINEGVIKITPPINSPYNLGGVVGLNDTGAFITSCTSTGNPTTIAGTNAGTIN